MNFLKGKNILVISPEAWGKSKLSKHHYAMTLASIGNKVWFLQPPDAMEYHAADDPPKDIILLKDHKKFPGARFYPDFIRKFTFKKIIRRMQNDTGVHFDLIWNFDNSRFFDLDCFENCFRIHHRMDYHYNFQNERACLSADLCLGVTSGIVDNMKPFNSHAYFIHHGYATPDISNVSLPPCSEKIKALYIGNLLIPFINWKWINALVKDQPDVHFYFAGSYGKSNLSNSINEAALKEVNLLKTEINVTFLGEKLPSEIYAYMNDADILFASYNAEEYPEILANSHKIMGYLGSGKPVVCHEIGEYLSNKDLLYMAKTEEEYLFLFNDVKNNLQEVSDEIHTSKRIEFALHNTYLLQLERIDNLILNIIG